MSGHSKWAQIKRQKGVADSRRGQVFTKLTRELTLAVRQGGSDPETNPRLRLAAQRARDYNMPAENIERAIKRASGHADESALSEFTLEGYAPGGAAVLVQVLTDNRNHTLAEVRHTFTRGGGSLGEGGCVSWLFEQKGVIVMEANEANAEDMALAAIDAGAEDVKVEGNSVEVYTKPQDLEAVRRALEQSFSISSAELSLIPSTAIKLDEKTALQALKLVDKLDELDGVQHVFTNADFPNDIVQGYQG